MKKLLGGCLLAVGLTSMISAPPAGADENVLLCEQGAGVATTATSCPFAEVVRNAYLVQGSNLVAYSPVTGQYYPMDCEAGHRISLNQFPWTQANAVRCQGGDNGSAVVWLW